jgi:hypothetical protein
VSAQMLLDFSIEIVTGIAQHALGPEEERSDSRRAVV